MIEKFWTHVNMTLMKDVKEFWFKIVSFKMFWYQMCQKVPQVSVFVVLKTVNPTGDLFIVMAYIDSWYSWYILLR